MSDPWQPLEPGQSWQTPPPPQQAGLIPGWVAEENQWGYQSPPRQPMVAPQSVGATAYGSPLGVEPPSIIATVIVTLFLDLWGLIPTVMASQKAKALRLPVGRYWRAFGFTLLGKLVVYGVVVALSLPVLRGLLPHPVLSDPVPPPAATRAGTPTTIPSSASTSLPSRLPSATPTTIASTSTPTPSVMTNEQARASLVKLRQNDVKVLPIDGRWAVIMAAKWEGVEDLHQTTKSGSHIFQALDIWDEHQKLRHGDNLGAPVLLVTLTDFGKRTTHGDLPIYATIALPAISSREGGLAWCAQRFPALSGEALENQCQAIQLSVPHD